MDVTYTCPRGGIGTERDKCQSRWNGRTARRASRSSFHFLYDAASTLLPLPSLFPARPRLRHRSSRLHEPRVLPRSQIRNSPRLFHVVSTATCGGREPHIYLGVIRFRMPMMSLISMGGCIRIHATYPETQFVAQNGNYCAQFRWW